jgi:hypothetical protein
MIGRRSKKTPATPSDPAGLSMRVVTLLADAVIQQMIVAGSGVHIDTALAGAAATAGAFMLRQSLGSALDGLSPGSAVIVDALNEEGPRVLGLAQSVASSAGIAWDSSAAEVPAENQLHRPHVDLVRDLEKPLSRVLRDNDIDRTAWANHTLLAAVDLIIRAGNVIDASVATRIVTWSFVVGSKTVPHPLTE